MSSDKTQKVAAMLMQVRDAIDNLRDWNASVTSEDDYYSSPGGMKNLAASCMLIEAIGETFKRIDKLTDGKMLKERDDIPWEDVIGIRNHIAHGYFDIDGAIVFDTVSHDLDPLADAVDYFLRKIGDSHTGGRQQEPAGGNAQ